MTVLDLDPAFEALLEFLKRARGFDFTGYKRTSLERRFRRRMDAIGCQSFGDYLDYLEVHPEEYEQLFDTLLINVTEFFRDPQSWEHLQQGVLPGAAGRQGRRTSRSASGPRAARPARRPTRPPWCWPRCSVTTRSSSG